MSMSVGAGAVIFSSEHSTIWNSYLFILSPLLECKLCKGSNLVSLIRHLITSNQESGPVQGWVSATGGVQCY